jgi:mono/diheme cytochrome c family protein
MRYPNSALVALASAATIALALPRSLSAQQAVATSGPLSTSPVSPAAVSAGRAIFHGQGGCFVCHGEKLEGGVGPTLRAHEWKDAKGGSLAAILSVVLHGVPGTAMVSHPNGISDSSAVRVATYVWAVSHGAANP